MSSGSMMIAGATSFLLGGGGLAVTASSVLPVHKRNVALLKQEERRLDAHQQRASSLKQEAREFHAKLLAELENGPKMLGTGSVGSQALTVKPVVKNEAAIAAKRLQSFNIPTTMNAIEIFGGRAAKTGRTLKVLGFASAALMAFGGAALLLNR